MARTRRREPDTEKTRERIIDATDALISSHGLSGTSVSGVARSLGMSHGNVYRHFRSKEALFSAVAHRWMSEMRSACEGAVDQAAPVAQNLTHLVLTIRQELLKRADNAAALDIYHFAQEHMREAAMSHHAHRAALVQRIVGDQRGAQEILDALRGFTDPTLLLATEGPDTSPRIEALCAILADSVPRTPNR